jgi:uncharacterized membrane protein
VAQIRQSVLAAGLIGVAAMAATDEVVFHQVLAWHHFYDRATPRIGLLSDGLLHAGEVLALIGGSFWLSDLRRRADLRPLAGWGGLLLGAGAFQVFDGLVHHKVLRVHQIRYGVDLLPYDLAWSVAGVAMVLLGAVVTWRAWSRRGGG